MNKSTRCLLSLFLVVCMTLSLFTGAFATTEATPEVTAITEKTATLVTNTAALKAGDQIIIAALNSDVALSTTQNTNNRAQAAVTKSGSALSFGDEVQVLTLEAGNVAGTFALKAGTDAYLYAASSSANNLKTATSITDNASWSISVDAATGVATVFANGTNSRNTLRYNSSSSLFSCYADATSQKDIAIYKVNSSDYYLFGYINGADYACEGDYENMGAYRFVNNKLTTVFNQDSYVGIKTSGNGAWYMTQSYAAGPKATLYNTNTGANEKLFVPGNVKVTFTLTINGDDSLGLSYEADPAECAHVYTAKVVENATCNSYARYDLICDACGQHETMDADDLAEQWLYSVPNGMNADDFNKFTAYRYRDYSDNWFVTERGTVSYVESWPTGFSTSSRYYTTYNNLSKTVKASETATSKVTVDSDDIIGYLYYHWCYEGYPYTSATETGSYNRFHVYFSTEDPSTADRNDPSDDSYRFDDSTACSDSNWYFYVPVYKQNYTVYGAGAGWGIWSDWSLSKVADSTTREVQTATLYSYKGATLAAHNYKDSVCTVCGDGCDHSFVYGKCTACGVKDPDYVVTYYLVGFINGKDYGCEADYENMGTYKFVDGKLTATFTKESYVFIKTQGNQDWYMTKNYTTIPTATFENTATTSVGEKLVVPANMEITFTLVEGENDTLTLSYLAQQPKCEHTYNAKVLSAATCQRYASYGLTCTKCGYYLAVAADELADLWLTAVPGSMSASQFEQKTAYSYRDFTEDWIISSRGQVNYVKSWPSGFSTSDVLYGRYNNASKKVTEATTATTKVGVDSDAIVGYLYYHWCYEGHPYTSAVKTGNYNRFHAWYSTLTPDDADWNDVSDDSYRFDDCNLCSDSDWYFYVPVYAQKYTNYSIGTGWGAWSDWSGTKATASSTREVRTASMYRFTAASMTSHRFVSSVCSVCGDACNHNYTSKVTTAATCTKAGVMTYNCSSCGKSYTEAISATGHNYSTKTTAATCTVPGVKVYTCTGCNHSYTETIPALGHSYTAKVTTAATCTTAGVKTYTCSNCKGTYTEAISATGHDYKTELVKPTCTAAGYTLYSCKNCTYSYTGNRTAALGHSYTSTTVPATCTTPGSRTETCTACGDTTTETLPLAPHSYTTSVVNATCTAAGSTTYTCKTCAYSFKEPIAATGHNYTTTVTSATCTTGGSSTYTCKTCGHSYKEDVAALGHNYTSVVTKPTCTLGGYTTYTCSACGHSYTGDKTAATGHTYVGGKCSGCGLTDAGYVAEYYLIGFINGANYGCEDDYANVGSYKFVNGKLTATFTQDSYVFLKTGDNANWYMSKTYVTTASGTFFHTDTGSNEKMMVPGNVQLTFTLTQNADGSLTLSYVTGDPVTPPENPDASVKPTLTLKAPTLEFKDMITVNAFYTAENLEDVLEMGMLTYSTKPAAANIATAEHVVPGATYDDATGRYYSCSQGIHAKYLGDTVYLAIYARLRDGSYAYSKVAGYSAVQYATSQLKNSTDASLKQLVVAMLNYGAEAQLYFGHNTGALANASLTAAQKALPEAYRADMIKAVSSPSTMKQGVFANNSGFSSRKPAISFEGAFCINYFFTPKYAPEAGITLYYWNASAYNRAGVLTTANATGSLKLTGSGTGEYRGDITGIAAKALSDAVYVAAVYENGGTTWTSGVLGYSIGAYCSSQASKGGTIANLAMATAVYGYHAKAYFA